MVKRVPALAVSDSNGGVEGGRVVSVEEGG